MMNRLWVEETNARRVELEKQIIKLLRVELELMNKKKDLYKEYEELISNATTAYRNHSLSVS
jgi:hypothetical protein